jgi:serine phosphatase RsbU (regulator of sigma subunit)
MQLIGEQLDTAFEEFRGLQNQRDDATVIGIRFKER